MRSALLILILLTAGCHVSSSMTGRPDAGSDVPAGDTLPPECSTLWDCNPGVECGSMIPCIDGVCRLDVMRIEIECPPSGECATDADCVVADPYDCCSGCPLVMARSELPEHACFQERGTAWPDPPPIECLADCFACPVCYPQPLSAVCRGGVCIEDETGCPGPEDGEIIDATPASVAADPHAFAGRIVRMSGSTITRWPACDDWCPGGEDCCEASLYLDGVVRLEGWPCEASLACTADDPCPDEWDCPFFPEGDHYEMTGELRAGSTWEPPSLFVTGVREIDPVGRGGRYDILVSRVDVWAEEIGVDCIPGAFVGDTGRVTVTDAGGELIFGASLFGCSEFWGSRDWSAFEVWVPIDCDGCCCDFWIDGTFGDGALTGTYHGWDGVCHVEIDFEGERS